jgi:cytochrome c
MSIITRALIVAAAAAAATAAAQTSAPARLGIGSPATDADLKQFTSPLPDGRGLPAGSGTVEQGRAIYVQSCAACHGDKLQGGIGDRLVGGRGTLVNNDPTKAPVKTVESYWPYATTLFDYIKRAMPMNAPGSLSDNQVYAVSAYILSQAKIIPENATLDAKSLAAVRMPNRDGFIPDPRPEKFPPADKTKHADKALSGG